MRTLTYSAEIGEFELDHQPIGNYIEIQIISSKQVRILHSMIHKPSNDEVVQWLNKLPTYRIHRMSTVFKWGQYVLELDRLQWKLNHKRRTPDA